MTVMYDSDVPSAIPGGVPAAGYCDGYAAAAWNGPYGFGRFTNPIRIAVFASTNDGHALDVENGDATPAQAPAWVRRRLAAGVARPWVYCNRSNRGAVENALRAAGLTADQVALWVATLDGTQTVPAGFYPVAAVQFANSALSGGHYDLSIVNDLYGPTAHHIGGDIMSPTDFKALVILAYVAASGNRRTPETQAAIDGWAAQYNGTNGDQIIAKIVNSPEFLADRGKANAEDAETPGIPSGTKLNITGTATVV